MVALITDLGSRAAFKTGWKRGTTLWEAEQQAKVAESEKLRLQKAAETRDKGGDSDGRIKCIVPNVMLEDTYYDNPCINPDIALNPCGNTDL